MPKKTKQPAGTPSPKNFIGSANDYIADVLNGTIPACKWVQLACQRQRDDLKRWSKADSQYVFSPEAGSRICQFGELFPHIKGPKAKLGELISLEPWQCFTFSTPFGWLNRSTGKRRFRKVYEEVPRGNAKSTKQSILGLYMGFADGESGAEIYSAATKKDQARVVFDVAQEMARRTPDFRNRFGVEVAAHSIFQKSSASRFVPLSSDDDSLDGLNIHLAIVDELHAHKTRGLYDVLETGLGKRDQSMLWAITTAGWNVAGICYEIRKYLTRILEGYVEDHGFFGIIYTIDDEDSDNWYTLDAIRKANPNWGISVDEEYALGLLKKAQQVPSAVNNYLTKILDVWVTSDAGLFDMRAWAKSADTKLKPEQFKDYPCWIAVDLGFVDDIAAVVQTFQVDDEVVIFGNYYLPEATVESSRNSQYSGWERSGYITQTQGRITDVGKIVGDIGRLLTEYDVREVPFDPYAKLILLNKFHEMGFPIDRLIEFTQEVKTMSPATERLMQLVAAGKVRHDGNPVLAWAMGNVIGKFDAKDNVYPRKESPDLKIDPAIAAIMNTGRIMISAKTSVYKTRGLITFA